MSSQKSVKILEVMRLLLEKSDDEHPLSVSDIIQELEKRGIESERKSIYQYMQQLEDFGLDIIKTKKIANYYHVGDREFQLAELKLLVDAVQFSKFITKEKSAELIQKIKSLTSIYQAEQLVRDDMISDRLKTTNTSIYFNVDAIHEAIVNKRWLQFKYFEYGLDKERHYRHNGEFYTMIPEFLCWDDEKYYCVMYHQAHEDHVIFRVDKMREVSVMHKTHRKLRSQEDFEKYCTRIFSMFQGEGKTVTLEFDKSLVSVVFDRFGLDIDIIEEKENTFIIEEEVLVSQTFLSWLFQFGNLAKILGPEEVVEEARQLIRKNSENYES